MMMSLMPLLLMTAAVVSFCCGLAGTGPSLAMVPIIHGLGLSFELARGVGLMVNIASLGGGTVQSLRQGKVDFSACTVMTMASLASAPVGAVAGGMLSDQVLNGALTVYLLSVLTWLLFFRTGQRTGRKPPSLIQLGCLGGVSGLVAGTLGIGGGGIVIPSLVVLGFDMKKAVVTNAFIVCCASVAGLFTMMGVGNFDAVAALPIALAAFVGGWFGVRVMHAHLSQETVRRLVLMIFVVLSFRQVWALVDF